MNSLVTAILLIILWLIAMGATPKVRKNSGWYGVLLMHLFIIACIIGKFMQYYGYYPTTLNN